jgi:hypothetical protein
MSTPLAIRLELHRTHAAMLASLSDEALAARLAGAPALHAGIGGRSVRLDLDGRPLFAKLVPLTELERQSDPLRTTRNLFALPLHCQYGLGGCPGFSVWRELEAWREATAWVERGLTTGFPLLHHWRVLPAGSAPTPTPEQCAFWEHHPAVRTRIEAVRDATAHVVFVTEHYPQNLLTWLTTRLRAGADAAAAAIALVDRELPAILRCLQTQGVVHFDPHFENLLTDGTHVVLADFGLTLSPRFALSPEDDVFLRLHLPAYDVGRAAVGYVHALTASLTPDDAPWKERLARLLAPNAATLPYPAADAALRRYGPLATAFLAFSRQLLQVKSSTYPAETLNRLAADALAD